MAHQFADLADVGLAAIDELVIRILVIDMRWTVSLLQTGDQQGHGIPLVRFRGSKTEPELMESAGQ